MNDHATPPDDEYAKTVCLVGQGERSCRYLGRGSGGWSCLKFSGERRLIDHRVAAGTFVSRGDNCAGRGGRITPVTGPNR